MRAALPGGWLARLCREEGRRELSHSLSRGSRRPSPRGRPGLSPCLARAATSGARQRDRVHSEPCHLHAVAAVTVDICTLAVNSEENSRGGVGVILEAPHCCCRGLPRASGRGNQGDVFRLRGGTTGDGRRPVGCVYRTVGDVKLVGAGPSAAAAATGHRLWNGFDVFCVVPPLSLFPPKAYFVYNKLFVK